MPINCLGLPGSHGDGAGRVVIVIAGGPSIATLKNAIQIVENPH